METIRKSSKAIATLLTNDYTKMVTDAAIVSTLIYIAQLI